jgi:general secretion pathway protein H
MRRGPRGFTLLEIMVVLVIAAVVYLLVANVIFRGPSAYDLKTSARTLAAALRQAQTTAMATRRDTTLTLDVDAREYAVTGEASAHKLPEGIDLKLYTAQSEVESERRGAIRFYPDGSSTGGRITIAIAERKYLVDVDWLTGRVSIND